MIPWANTCGRFTASTAIHQPEGATEPEPAEATLEVCESLPSHHSEARAGLGASEAETPLDIRYMEEAARHDLRAAFGLIEAGKLSVSETSRQPSAASSKALSKVLLGGDFYDDDALESQDQSSYYDPIGSMRGFVSRDNQGETRASIKVRRRCVVAGSIMDHRLSGLQAISRRIRLLSGRAGSVSS